MRAVVTGIARAVRGRTRIHALMLALLTGCLPSNGAAQVDPVKDLVQQGKYWQSRSRHDRAAEVWLKLLRINPSQPDALYGMGFAELEAGRTQSARTYLERLQKASPDSPLAGQLQNQIVKGGSAGTQQQVEQARELARSGQSEKAVKRYEDATGGKVPQGDPLHSSISKPSGARQRLGAGKRRPRAAGARQSVGCSCTTGTGPAPDLSRHVPGHRFRGLRTPAARYPAAGLALPCWLSTPYVWLPVFP
ncbi:tetratricopeptide repeat protein [Cupriavidus sp. AcVe19-1a]|uniref:tetratricopeptide repeat protein n=1 Tax=Cupriavidus sp. AcVe19-1a TaxID=2821359 RepID=UPI001FD81B2C|nr:tetratricopeptide repeat protein [Cupriavidus sp. AcVe19-1a]